MINPGFVVGKTTYNLHRYSQYPPHESPWILPTWLCWNTPSVGPFELQCNGYVVSVRSGFRRTSGDWKGNHPSETYIILILCGRKDITYICLNNVSSKVRDSAKRLFSLVCRYQNIQRTMATEEDGSSQRLERSSSTEADPDAPQSGTASSSSSCRWNPTLNSSALESFRKWSCWTYFLFSFRSLSFIILRISGFTEISSC